jgi:hypothetical protein
MTMILFPFKAFIRPTPLFSGGASRAPGGLGPPGDAPLMIGMIEFCLSFRVYKI